jgi:hypothetical protein
MPLHAILEDARNALRQGDTAGALKTLIDRLPPDPAYTDVLRALRVVEAGYNTARQQELKGLLTFNEAQRAYNKANDAILSLIDQLAAGTQTIPRTRNRSRRLLLLGLSALLLASIIFTLFRLRQNDACPDWDETGAFRVIILPFESYGGPVRDPASALSDSIRILTRKNNLLVGVKTSNIHSRRPLDPDEARSIGANCSADLVIWGKYAVDEQDRIRVRMGHVFVQSGGEEKDISSVLTFSDITEIGPERSLQDAILGICTRIALHEGNLDAARKWLRKMEAPEQSEKEQMKLLERGMPQDDNPGQAQDPG